MNAPERFSLQFGPYAAPKVPRNNRLFCELRGYLKVSPSWSDGPIPWPQRFRTGSIILCGDLVRALKMESVEAICFHWGVCRNVVQNWRHTLGVPEFNPGTQRLRNQVRAGLNSPARQRATLRAKHPTAILKREKAPHEAAHPLVRPSTSLLVRERMARTGRHINPQLRLWTAKEDKLLGTARDEQIAKKIHRSEDAVRARRNTLGIPAWKASYSKPWTAREDTLLGVVPHHVLAKRLKRTFLAVQTRPLGDTVLGQETGTSPGTACSCLNAPTACRRTNMDSVPSESKRGLLHRLCCGGDQITVKHKACLKMPANRIPRISSVPQLFRLVAPSYSSAFE